MFQFHECVERVKLTFFRYHQCNYSLIVKSVHLRQKQRSDTIYDLGLLPVQCNGRNLDYFWKYYLQSRIQNPVKHLRWSVLRE